MKFTSITHALRAKEIIENNGGQAKIRKNLNPSKNEGCGYSVIATGNINKILSIININKINYIGYEYL